MRSDIAPRPAPSANRVEHRGISLELPKEWIEESVLFVQAPGERPQPTLALVRATVAPDTSLELYAARKVAEASSMYPDLEVEDSHETVVDGQRAMLLRLAWNAPAGRHVQRMLVLRSADAMFVLTGTGLEEHIFKLQLAFDGVVGSLRFGAR